ncbi:hypothetical protein ACCO45_001546 [Purpureocillium lilacinum]|uniref:Uncharacterized protein n=1 Tax=Purpureocillium lilacinum TaxID=33203 RepID=A0ACC4E8G7_PURLI
MPSRLATSGCLVVCRVYPKRLEESLQRRDLGRVIEQLGPRLFLDHGIVPVRMACLNLAPDVDYLCVLARRYRSALESA